MRQLLTTVARASDWTDTGLMYTGSWLGGATRRLQSAWRLLGLTALSGFGAQALDDPDLQAPPAIIKAPKAVSS